MYMSIVSLPNIRLFRKKSMNIAAVSKVMTRDRFDQILSVLPLANNHIQPKKGDPDFDCLFKVRQFLTNLRTHFKQNEETEAVVSVDEQMIPYKGTLGIKVYMKNKPLKWGIKV
jgi:hypothetical protein